MSDGNYDLLLTRGRVLDPGNDIDKIADVAVRGGEIAKITPGIAADSADRVIDVSGRIVTPGLIDLHTHVAEGLAKVVDEGSFAPVDLVGVNSGVTTVVDAGSTGAYNVGGMVNYVIPHAATRVICFINTGTLGIFRIPEVRDAADIDIDHAIATIKASDAIRGVKVRMVSPSVQEMGVDLARQAKAISSGADVPLMVHIGDIPADHPKAGEAAPALLSDVLGPGDVVTHTCSNHVGGLLDNGKLRPEAMAARERGVWFDVGVGRANFTFDSAKAVMDQGLIPDTISSDVTAPRRMELVHGLVESMNKFLALGMSLSNVVQMTPRNAARVLGMEGEIGSIEPSVEADLSVLSLATGDWVFRDPAGGIARSTQAIMPEFAVRAGIPQPLDPGPRSWGWEPEWAS